MADLLGTGGFGSFSADLFKFSRIQPVPAAIGTLIHLDTPFGAEEMTVEFDVRASRAIPFAGSVYHNPLIALNMKQRFPGGFVLFVDALQFERVKPDPAAALANIDLQTADLYFF